MSTHNPIRLPSLSADIAAQLLRAVYTVVAVVIVAIVVLLLGGSDPMVTLKALVQGATGTNFNIGESMIRFAPVLIIAVGLVPSLRIGLFNIGAPGQIGIGGLFCTFVILHTAALPGPVSWVMGIVLAAVGGALWAWIPALLRARLGINEVISTLVFNFIAINLLTYLLNGPMRAAGANIPESETLSQHQWLPVILTGTRLHAGVLLAVVAVVGLAWWQRTPSGYRSRLLGANKSLGRQAGVHEAHAIVRTMLIGGAAAGIAGWMQVVGIDHRLMSTVADPVGYTGLFAALLGALVPLGLFVSSLFLGGLLQGGNSLQIGANIPPELSQALLGVILLVVALQQQSSRGKRRTRVPRAPAAAELRDEVAEVTP